VGYAIDIWEIPSLPIAGSDDRFPVRRIFCVGRNYAAHVVEMGFDPSREEPFFFTKPADAIVQDGATIPYPLATENYHHEIELVAAIGTGGREIVVDQANDHIFGYAVGLDMTRRDLQLAARDKGRPWDMGKAFDQSAPCGTIVPAAQSGHPTEGAVWVTVDGETRQSSDLSHLIWKVPEIVNYLSGLVELKPGDLIYTGTPDGVGPVKPGQTMNGHIDGIGDLTIKIAA
jgi:fumarylpyruvate hydrolase